MEQTFLTTKELFGSPLNNSMADDIPYCSAFPEDVNFGAILNSFLYQRTASCIINPEYEPEDMLKVVLHALASSECTDTTFLVVLILPVWDDTPWSSKAIRGHTNTSTLIRIPTGCMRFVPAHKKADDSSMELTPAKWPVDLVLIANEEGRAAAFLDTDMIHVILALAIKATCRLNPEETIFFLPPLSLRHTTSFRTTTHPTRPLPTNPAT
jgi:hypothetical protein